MFRITDSVAVFRTLAGFAEGAAALPSGTHVKLLHAGQVLADGTFNGSIVDFLAETPIPVAALQEDAAYGYELVEGGAGLTADASGWTIVANDANPIVRVRFPLVGTTNTAQRCGLHLDSITLDSPSFTAGRPDLDTAFELRCVGESGGADLHSGIGTYWIGSNMGKYNFLKTAPTTWSLDALSNGTALFIQHEVFPDSTHHRAGSLAKTLGASDDAGADFEADLSNTGIVTGVDGWFWEVEVHQGAPGSSITLVVTHIEWGAASADPT